jgi:hypothetical protein
MHTGYLRCYYYHWVDTSSYGLLVPEGITRPVVSASAMTWFIIYFVMESPVSNSCNYLLKLGSPPSGIGDRRF